MVVLTPIVRFLCLLVTVSRGYRSPPSLVVLVDSSAPLDRPLGDCCDPSRTPVSDRKAGCDAASQMRDTVGGAAGADLLTGFDTHTGFQIRIELMMAVGHRH
jgi:hypothetical protein